MMRLNLLSRNWFSRIMTLTCMLIFFNPAYALNMTPSQKEWIDISASFPSAQEQINVLTSFHKKLYAAGNTVYQFNDATKKPGWSAVSSGLPTSNTQRTYLHSLLAFNDRLYVGGETYICNFEQQSCITNCRAIISVYDEATQTWTSVPSTGLPKEGIYISKLENFNGKLIALVGSSPSYITTYPVFIYDEKTKSWAALPSNNLNNTNYFMNGIAVFNGKLYLAGGSNDQKLLIYVYNDASFTWVQINNGIPASVHWIAVINSLAVMNDTLFAAGYDDSAKGMVYAYNGNDNAPLWIDKTAGLPFDASFPHRNDYGSSFVSRLFANDNILYAAGININGDPFVYSLKGSNLSAGWQPAGIGPLNLDSFFTPTALAVYNNSLFMTEFAYFPDQVHAHILPLE